MPPVRLEAFGFNSSSGSWLFTDLFGFSKENNLLTLSFYVILQTSNEFLTPEVISLTA